jgi:MOSC domain-containing protein YiiM
MNMKLISVNVSPPKEIQYKGESVTTGIFKTPVPGRIMLRELNLDGDGQADLTVHGGVHKAVYVYPAEHYEYWKQKLGRHDLAYGQFGENFTVTGMLENQIHIGDIFRVGVALVQATQPRVPCYKLAIKMHMPQFPKLFMASARTGFYLRVLQEGEVGAGDLIERVQIDPEKMTVQEIFHLAYRDQENFAALNKTLRLAGLSPDWQSMFAERLAAR